MAIFNPTPDDVNAPSFLGYSKEPDKKQSDRSMEILFSGLGDAIGGAISMADEATKTQIKNEAYSAVDPIRNQSTADALMGKGGTVTGVEAGGGQEEDDDLGGGTEENPMPRPVATQVARLGTMKAGAEAAGPSAETDYWIKLETKARELRARYPGYRDQIDAAFASITGSQPANAARRSALRDLAASQRAESSAANKIEKQFLQDREHLLRYDPEITLEKYAANKSKYDVEAGKLMANDQKLKSDNLELDNMEKNAKHGAETTKRVFTEVAATEVDTVIGAGIRALEKRVEAARKQGANVSPQEVDEINQAAAQLEHNIRTKLYNKANERRLNSKNELAPSYAMRMGGMDEINKIIDDQIAPIKFIQKAVSSTNGDGLAKAAANLVQMRKNADLIRLQDKIPEIRIGAAMEQGLGSAAVGAMMQGSGVYGKAVQALHDTSVLGVVGNGPGSAPPPKITDGLLGERGPDGKPKPPPGPVTRMYFKNWQTLATDENPEIAARAVESLYTDPKLLSSFTEKERGKVFATLASPEFSKKMIALGQTKPEAFAQYSAWVENSFASVGKPAVDTLQKDIVQFNRYKTEFNAEGWRFVATPNDKYNDYTSGSEMSSRYVERSLSPINGFLQQVRPVLEAKYGKEGAQKELMKLLGAAGYNPEAPKGGTVVESIGDAFFKAIGKEPPTREKKKEEPSITPNPREGLSPLPAPSGLNAPRPSPIDVPPVQDLGNDERLPPRYDGSQNPLGIPSFERRSELDDAKAQLATPVREQAVQQVQAQLDEKPLAGNLTLTEPVKKSMLELARQYVGLHEGKNASVIASFVQRGTGKTIDPTRTPWCAGFANFILKEGGHEGTGGLWARGLLAVGKPVKEPKEGDLVILSRGRGKGHVGFYAGTNKDGTINVVGGNQKDKVSEAPFKEKNVLGYRRVSSLDAQKFAEEEGLVDTMSA